MAAVLLVLFLVTFLFHTRLGLAFLLAAIVVLYRGAPAKKLKVVRDDPQLRSQKTWADPWRTGDRE